MKSNKELLQKHHPLVLLSAARLQRILQEAVLVGGTAQGRTGYLYKAGADL